MCWSMWAEYRYSSPMSCSGQSLATHSITIAPTKQPMLNRVTAGWPAGGATGAYVPSLSSSIARGLSSSRATTGHPP